MIKGSHMSAEARAKISLVWKGKHHSEETKMKISAANKGKHRTEEQIKALSERVKGEKHPNYGKHHSQSTIAKMVFSKMNVSEETRKKLSLASKGRIVSEETRNKIGLSNKGKIRSEESSVNMSLGRKGMRFTEEHKANKSGIHNPNFGKHLADETRNKIRLSRLGKYGGINHPWFGKHHSEATKIKLRLAHQGEKSSLWRGGHSGEKYPFEFNHKLKEIIRERDGYLCQVCHKEQNGERLSIHHIDYNKNNLNHFNLVSLCRSCHQKTDFKREYYIEYFKILLQKTEVEVC